MKTLLIGSLVVAGCFTMACSPATSSGVGTGGTSGVGGTAAGVGGNGAAPGAGGNTFATGGTTGVGGSTLPTGGTTFATGGTTFATGGTTFATGGTTNVATGGTGNTSSTGGTTGNTGGTTSSGPCGADYSGTVTTSTIATDGYVTSGDLMGYAFTWTGKDGEASDCVTPETFEASGTDLCASGSLGMSYDSIMALGFNVNQPVGEDPAAWVTSGTGLTYDVKNPGGTPLRIQITEPGGSPSYCAEISATGTLAWEDFNTECWGTDGTDFIAGTEIESITVTAPGDETEAREPAFCIVSIAVAN